MTHRKPGFWDQKPPGEQEALGAQRVACCTGLGNVLGHGQQAWALQAQCWQPGRHVTQGVYKEPAAHFAPASLGDSAAQWNSRLNKAKSVRGKGSICCLTPQNSGRSTARVGVEGALGEQEEGLLSSPLPPCCAGQCECLRFT